MFTIVIKKQRISYIPNGFHPDAENEFRKMKESPHATAGWPQLYIMDPDRNVIELNAERLDEA